MKKLLTLMLTVILALALLSPALADAADPQAEEAVAEAAGIAEEAAGAVGETAEAAVEAALTTEEAVEETAEEGEDASEEDEEEDSGVSLEKFTEVPWYSWAVLAALVVAGVLLAMNGKRAQWNSRRLSMGAMCIAIAFVLSCIRLFRMPQGGSITPAAMLPLVLFMVACGPLQGFVVGCAFGLLKLITGPEIIHPIQMLVDYPLAYGAMILGCLATVLPVNKRWQLPLAALLAGFGRYVMAVLSGAIFFSEYAGEQNAWIYSLVYNISYIGPDVVVCMVVAALPGMTRLVDTIRKKG